MKHRFHVVALPHTSATSAFTSCAYTSKVSGFVRMMRSLGHHVTLYSGGDEPEFAPDEWVQVLTPRQQEELYSTGSYDHGKEFFKIEWDPKHPNWTVPNARTIAELAPRLGPRDFICLIGGVCQRQIADAFPGHMSVEFGIGYKGVFSKYRVFESYAWMHWVLGSLGIDDGSFYDAVIPNYFDPEHFPLGEQKDDYFVYLGRIIDRKGWRIAVETTAQISAKLIMAGQYGKELPELPDHVEYIGSVGRLERGELLAGARGCFVPTTYVEPFGGVSIESMLCGTPVISTDWGAFAENNIHGLTGYRARTLGEFVHAARSVDELDPARIRQHAVRNFSLKRVRHQYDAYFDQLHDLWEANGWYSLRHRGVSEQMRYDKHVEF